jgi:hypothetical protein
MFLWLLPKLNGITYAAFLPPDSKGQPLDILRESFIHVTEDEEYRSEEAKMFGFNLPVVSPEHGTSIIEDMTNAPEHVRDFLDQYIQQGR